MNTIWRNLHAHRTAWRSNVLVNSFVVTFKLVHQRVHWPCCMMHEMVIWRCPLSTRNASECSCILINEHFFFSFLVGRCRCRRCFAFGFDLKRKRLMRGRQKIVMFHFSNLKMDSVEVRRQITHLSETSAKQKQKIQSRIRSVLAFILFFFQFFFSFVRSFNSKRENYSRSWCFFFLAFFICFLFRFCYLRAKLTHTLSSSHMADDYCRTRWIFRIRVVVAILVPFAATNAATIFDFFSVVLVVVVVVVVVVGRCTYVLGMLYGVGRCAHHTISYISIFI